MKRYKYTLVRESRRNKEQRIRAIPPRRMWFASVGVTALGIVALSGCGAGFDEAYLAGGNTNQVAKVGFLTPVDTGLVESLDVELSCPTEGATIYYTLDGSEPDESSLVYRQTPSSTDSSDPDGSDGPDSMTEDPTDSVDGAGDVVSEDVGSSPIHIVATTTVKARAYKQGMTPGEASEATYSISGYPLGMLPMEPTQYSSIPLAMIPAMGDLPPVADLRPFMPPAGNQGQQGSCVGWAVGYALKTYQENVEHGWGAGTDGTQFSPSYIYNQIRVGNCMSGSYIFEAFDVLTSQGCSTLATMPYNPSTCNSSPNNEAREEAGNYRIASWRRVNAQDPTELRAQLAGGFPIVIGMRVYTNFFSLRGTQIYDKTEGSWQGNHAITIVGYDDETSSFEIINSWGTGWGNAGYARISYDVLSEVTFEAYVAQDIVEQTYTLELTTSGDGSATLDPQGGTYFQGQTVQLSATAPDGWGFARWEGDLTGWTNPATVTMDSDKSVLAVFEQDTYTLTIVVEGGGTTDPPAGQHAFVTGEEVQVTATPDQGCQEWSFGQWSRDASGTADAVTVLIDGHKAITAAFVAGNQTPAATDQQVAGTMDTPVDVTLTGSDPEGNPLTFEVLGNPSHGTLEVVDLPVVHYTPDNGFSGTDSFTFRASDGCTWSDTGTVELYLGSPIQYSLTVTVNGEGDVDPFVGTQTFSDGTEVTLTATPTQNWQFQSWEGGVSGTDPSTTFRVDSNMAVEAVFILPPVDLNVSVTPEGSGTVALDPPGGSYLPGTLVTLTASAAGGYGFAQWEGDLTGTDYITTVTVEPGLNIVASFDQNPPSISLRDSRTRIPWVVSFDMRLRDGGGRAIVDGVTKDNFFVYEDGSLLDYTETNQFVTPGAALPLKVMLVLDYTQSMKAASAIDPMISAAERFVLAKNGAGESVFTGTHTLGIIEFHDRTELGVGYDEVIPLTRTDTGGKNRIVEAIPCETCRYNGLSRVWDSVDLAMTKILAAPSQEGEARAVVFLTDGRDTTSVVSTDELIATAQANDIMLYPIGFGNLEDYEAVLQECAEQTGGLYFPAAGAASLDSVFAEIAKDLNGQWNLTYITERNSGDVDVRVEFEWEGTAEFTTVIDAGIIAGDPYVGYMQVLSRAYDPYANLTTFLLKAEYVPRNISNLHLLFGDAGATLTLQDEGGLVSGWTMEQPGGSEFEVFGPTLQYGAFGNIGSVTVPGDVARLKIQSSEIRDEGGSSKAIVFEGNLWE